MYVRKGEPKRRSACASARARIVEPDTKTPSPSMTVTDASPLLVILHYLLKNNTQFIGWNVQVKLSPGHPSVTNFIPGGN